jgi:hypothetical protein
MMKIPVSDIVVELVLALILMASIGGYLSLGVGLFVFNPSVILFCMVMVYCVGKIARAIETKAKSETIEVRVVQEAPQSYYRPSANHAPNKEEEVEDEPMPDINSEVLAKIHGMRMKETMGQSNISHHEHETDGNQTMESLKALQGMKDANR